MATKRVYTYPFTMTRVIDGDTIEGYADMGFYTKRLVSVRLLGVNTPEKTGAEKEAGLFVKDRVLIWMKEREGKLQLESKKLDKFGRVLGDFYTPGNQGLAAYLLVNKLAKAYTSGKPPRFSAKDRADIVKRKYEV